MPLGYDIDVCLTENLQIMKKRKILKMGGIFIAGLILTFNLSFELVNRNDILLPSLESIVVLSEAHAEESGSGYKPDDINCQYPCDIQNGQTVWCSGIQINCVPDPTLWCTFIFCS
jgi:hypothetical protein